LAFARSSRAGEAARAGAPAEKHGVRALGQRVYSARATKRPDAAVVYLHGICGRAENGCPHFTGAGAWLVCPQANVDCPNGGSSWGGGPWDKLATVERAEARVRAGEAEAPPRARVLVGFSQGAFTAVELARAYPGRFPRLLLAGAHVKVSARDLRAWGVERIAFTAGAYDDAYPTLRETAWNLDNEGFPVRFGSLGKVGHVYIAEDGTDDALTALTEWLLESTRSAPRPGA
jgi:predicted esterase